MQIQIFVCEAKGQQFFKSWHICEMLENIVQRKLFRETHLVGHKNFVCQEPEVFNTLYLMQCLLPGALSARNQRMVYSVPKAVSCISLTRLNLSASRGGQSLN